MCTNKLASLVGNDVCYIKLVRFPLPKKLFSARVWDHFKRSIIFFNLCCTKARHLQMHHCKPDIWQETVQWGSHSCFLVTLMIHDVQLFMYTTTLLIHNCTSTTPSWWSIASGILSRASHNHCDEKMGSGKGSGNIHWKCCLRGLAKHLTKEDTCDPK